MIGIFGGTFDPPHYGHVNLALSLAEAHRLSEVWIVPTRVNPFKMGQESAPFVHRIEMARLAFGSLEGFQVLDIEKSSKTPSYTVDTLIEIRKRTKEPLALLLGEDAANSLPEWKEPRQILSLATVLIGGRPGSGPSASPQFPELQEALRKGWTPIPQMEISSTWIRQRLPHFYCGHLLAKEVIDYIRKFGLYFLGNG